MAANQKPNVHQYLNTTASFSADLLFAFFVGCGAALVAAALPLNWIPIVGPQAPGVAGGLVGGLFLYRARSNSPLRWQAGK